ncbi:Cbei [Acrasis kona]|uniref:Cbei n=1 Tax=Acrasis kona TaxID=1008807 RepID=A0AAW2ZEP5_9EUKA
MSTGPDFEAAKQFVFSELEKLDKSLLYHGRHHTFEDVLPTSIRLCKEENLDEDQTLIVKTAALFHDVGFLDYYEKNEPKGVERAKVALPKFGYNSEQIEKVAECIMATQLPQSPGDNILARIVCDSDLSHVGTNLFFIKSEYLRLELCLIKNIDVSPRKWTEGNLKFLNDHKYFTDSAKRVLQPQKEKNYQLSKELLGL